MPKIILSRNDSQPGGEIIREIDVDEFVQITYDTLRVGPEGDFIGGYVEGVWMLDDEGNDPSRWYSDLTIVA